MLDIEGIEALARALEGSPVTEMVVADGETEVRFVRRPTYSAPEETTSSTPEQDDKIGPVEHLIVARRVGIYHIPQRPVHPGDRIEAGEIVGFIESVRIPNEVIADYSGIVLQVYVEDGSPVEYGQELFLLKEMGDGAAVDG